MTAGPETPFIGQTLSLKLSQLFAGFCKFPLQSRDPCPQGIDLSGGLRTAHDSQATERDRAVREAKKRPGARGAGWYDPMLALVTMVRAS